MLREGGQWKKNEAEKKLNKQCIKLNSIKYGQACACMTSTESNNVQQLSRCSDMSFQHACMCNRNFFYPRFLALCHVQALCAMFTNAWIVYLLISKPASNNPTIRHSSHRRHTQTFHTFSSNLKRQLFNVSAWGIFTHIWKACCHTHEASTSQNYRSSRTLGVSTKSPFLKHFLTSKWIWTIALFALTLFLRITWNARSPHPVQS